MAVLRDRDSGKEYKDFSTSGNSSWIEWDMENPGWIELSISNISDTDVTYVIALN